MSRVRSIGVFGARLALALGLVACGHAQQSANCPTDGESAVGSRGVATPDHSEGLHFDHLAVLVTDLERSVQFYEQTLGLGETFDATDKANIRWFSLGSDRQLHLIEVDSLQVVPPKGVHLALTTSRFEPFVQGLRRNAVAFESWLGDKGQSNLRPDGVRQVYLQDPDGYWIEVNDASTKWPTPKAPR